MNKQVTDLLLEDAHAAMEDVKRLRQTNASLLEALEVVSHDPDNGIGWIVMVDAAIRKAKGEMTMSRTVQDVTPFEIIRTIFHLGHHVHSADLILYELDKIEAANTALLDASELMSAWFDEDGFADSVPPRTRVFGIRRAIRKAKEK